MRPEDYDAALKAYAQAVRDLERVGLSDPERFQAAYQRLEEARRAYEQARENLRRSENNQDD